jgi:cation transport protein ChaC
MSDFWVFGYGSLMWRPGFDHVDAVPAHLMGAHRALCVYSWVHRGTKHKPGLVLGLDRGGSCRGIAFRVSGARRDDVLAYLRERELVTDVYRETWRPVGLLDGGGRSRTVEALTYVVRRDHQQYAGVLSRDRLFRYVRDSHGHSGANADYVISTARHLHQLGLSDPTLDWLAERLAAEKAAPQAAIRPRA